MQKGDLVLISEPWREDQQRVGLVLERTSWEASPDPRVPDILYRRSGWRVFVDGEIENIENHLIKKLDI